MLRVKIVCTIGPTSREPEVLRELMNAGMNVVRLNMSHGTHEYHRGTIERVRAISHQVNKPIAILADLQGPKLRVGKMQTGGVPLVAGEELILTVEDIIGVSGRVPIQYKSLPETVQSGETIMLDDGLLELLVLETSITEIKTQVVIGGMLHDNKGMNLPNASLSIPALTSKDREDVQFALEEQADWIALSFVRTADEVEELRALLQAGAHGGRVIPIISKIEKPEAVKNIDTIIQASDAIMVARGDLGIETSPEEVPMVQKTIISKCHVAAKPVITATQMLDSMIRNPRPTRAEASDVANAVLDGSDAIMLSGETASGSYPTESVATMAKIATEAEQVFLEKNLGTMLAKPDIFTGAGAICLAAVRTAADVGAKAIIAPTVSGATAKFIAGFRPKTPVVAVTPDPQVQRQLCLHWGTYPLLSRRRATTDEVLMDSIQVVQKHGYIGYDDIVVLTAGVVGGVRSATNLMMVRKVERVLVRGHGIGQREVAGKLALLDLPLNGNRPVFGPDDIVVVDHLEEETADLLQHAAGVVVREEGAESLSAQTLHTLSIPAVIGIQENFDQLVAGQRVVLNANTGQVTKWER